MRCRSSRLIAAIAWSVLAWTASAQGPRSVAFGAAPLQSSESFVASESAAVFIGVRTFDEGAFPTLQYTVDDAVDLAYAVAIDRAIPLVEPQRVVLLLSGEPSEDESKRRLDELIKRGAETKPATHSKILRSVEKQALLVRPNGILIIGIATHGFTSNQDGEHYILGEDSVLHLQETLVRTNRLLQLAAQPDVRRSLVLLDTCRTNRTVLPDPSRGLGDDHPAPSQPLRKALAEMNGRAILKAAVEGRNAFEDKFSHHGVFTGAVLDGLRCSCESDERGMITVEKLGDFVDRRVVSWLNDHEGEHLKTAIEILDRGVETMPLAQCAVPSPPPEPRSEIYRVIGQTLRDMIENAREALDITPVNVRTNENTFNVHNAADTRLWSGEVKGEIVHAEIADLDGDGEKEVIVGVAGRGEDAGKILVFDAHGRLRWKADTTATFNYDNARTARLVVRTFVTGDLFRSKTRQIVVLSQDAHGFYPSRLTILGKDGSLLGSYWHPGRLNDVIVAAATPNEDPRIIVSGVNVELHWQPRIQGDVRVVFVLDPRAVAGEAPPYNGNAGRGTQLWYGMVAPTQSIEDLEAVDFDRDGRKEISFRSSSVVFYLTFTGGLKDASDRRAVSLRTSFRLVPR